MSKPVTALLCALGLSATLLAGCLNPMEFAPGGVGGPPPSPGSAPSAAPAGSSAAEPPLHYWYSGSRQVYGARIQEFNDQGGLQVEGLYVPAERLLEKLHVAAWSESTPDMATLQDGWMAQLFAQEVCRPLDDDFAAWEESTLFPAEYVEAVRRKALDGKLYALPQSSTLATIRCRNDRFAARGLESPASWEEFFAAARQLTYTDEAGQRVYGYSLQGGPGSAQLLLGQLVAYVGLPTFFDEQGNAQVLRDPAALAFMQELVALYQSGCCPEASLNAPYKMVLADFTAGAAGMMLQNLTAYEDDEELFPGGRYGAVPYPPSVRGGYTTLLPAVKGAAIFQTAEDPAACWAFLQHLCSEQSMSRSCEAMGELPTRSDCLSEEWVGKAPHLQAVLPYLAQERVFVASPAILPDFSSIAEFYAEPAFQEVLAGKTTAEAFLEEYATRLEIAYQEYVENVGPLQ